MDRRPAQSDESQNFVAPAQAGVAHTRSAVAHVRQPTNAQKP